MSTVGLQSESNNAKQERRVMESIGTGERVQLSEAGVQNSPQGFMHSTSTQGMQQNLTACNSLYIASDTHTGYKFCTN